MCGSVQGPEMWADVLLVLESWQLCKHDIANLTGNSVVAVRSY